MTSLLVASFVGGLFIIACGVVPMIRAGSGDIVNLSLAAGGFYFVLFAMLHLLSFRIIGQP